MKIFKIVLDILMFIITFALMEIDNTGYLYHEILGITMGVLLLIHIISNFKWIKQITKNLKKVNTKTKIMYFVDIITMIIYIATIICGILISHQIFSFRMSSNLYVVLGHLILGRLATIIMMIHVSLHFDKFIKNMKTRIIFYILYSIFTLLIIIYLIYSLTHSFQWMYVFNGGW